MSRIGNMPVDIPEGITIDYKPGFVSVTGPKGTLEQKMEGCVDIEVRDNRAIVKRKDETKRTRSLHGLYRKLLSNMVTGVNTGFSKTLLVNGVGYRVEVQGDFLILNIGYSNPVEYYIPEGTQIACEGTNKIIVSGIDRQKVGQVSSEIRSLRPPEPYKGKGIKYEDELVRRKIGKTGVK